jgi:hypothetical protein
MESRPERTLRGAISGGCNERNDHDDRDDSCLPRCRQALALFSGLTVLLTCFIIVLRFRKGLGATTNLSQEVPGGIWKGFNVVTGVALAGGAYVMAFMVHILGLKKYHAIVRLTVLNGFLAYTFYIGALLLELPSFRWPQRTAGRSRHTRRESREEMRCMPP